jgi:hypothetical protein
MALDPRLLQMNKILSVSAARTRRMEQSVEMTASALQYAKTSSDLAIEARAQASETLCEARKEMASEPASEQHRFWHEKCTRILEDRRQDVVDAADAVAQAQDALSHATRALMRQQLRHERLIETRHAIGKSIKRIQENRIEDDRPAMPNRNMALGGAML